MPETDLPPQRGLLFLRALRASLARMPLWLVIWAVELLAALVIALPWVEWFRGALAHHYEPGSLFAGLDEVFRFDHRTGLGELRAHGSWTAAVLAPVLMLFGVFAAGGWLQVFLERTSGHSLRRFFWGGAKYFWRFLRVWILSLFALAVLSWLVHGWPWRAIVLSGIFGTGDGGIEDLTSELTVARLEWAQHALWALGFVFVLTWGEYTRTRLALHGTRSAVWAWIASWFLIVLHPVRTLRPLALLWIVEVGVVVGLGTLSWGTNLDATAEGGWQVLTSLQLLAQIAMLWQVVCHGAHYFATVDVSRRLVAPLPKPDPWSKRIGGPGGPQYPIDDTDAYNVSF